MREEIGRREDGERERAEDDALVAEAVAECSARDAAECAAAEEQRQKRAGDEWRVARAHEQERQERRDGDMRPAAQAHRDVQPHDGGIREHFAERQAIACRLLHGREMREAGRREECHDDEARQDEPGQAFERPRLREGDDDDGREREADVAAGDVERHGDAGLARARDFRDER